jgi:hypothetical protein
MINIWWFCLFYHVHFKKNYVPNSLTIYSSLNNSILVLIYIYWLLLKLFIHIFTWWNFIPNLPVPDFLVCCLVCNFFYLLHLFWFVFLSFFVRFMSLQIFFVCFCISYLIIFAFSFFFVEYLVYFFDYISLNNFCCNI